MAAEGVRGSIINVSSQMGHVGGPNRSVYCASKWAMEGWTKAMAIDLAPLGRGASFRVVVIVVVGVGCVGVDVELALCSARHEDSSR